jgi:hypothetical protein
LHSNRCGSTRWFSDTGPMKAIFAQRYCFYMS